LMLAPYSGPSRRGPQTLAQVEKSSRRPALTAPARVARLHAQAGTKERPARHERRNSAKQEIIQIAQRDLPAEACERIDEME